MKVLLTYDVEMAGVTLVKGQMVEVLPHSTWPAVYRIFVNGKELDRQYLLNEPIIFVEVPAQAA